MALTSQEKHDLIGHHLADSYKHLVEALTLIEGGWEEVLLLENSKMALEELMQHYLQGKVQP